MTWPMTQTCRQRFEAGWTKYVKPELSFPPVQIPIDVYWDPRKCGWYTYPTNLNDVQDKGWPKVDLSGFLVVPGTTYDHITDQYGTLPHDQQPAACWDPRRAQWMYVWTRGASLAPSPPRSQSEKDAALRKVIAEVDGLYQQGYIGAHVKDEIEALIHGEM